MLNDTTIGRPKGHEVSTYGYYSNKNQETVALPSAARKFAHQVVYRFSLSLGILVTGEVALLIRHHIYGY